MEGKVTGITKFGAFVALPGNKTGMVHISEIAHAYVSDINEYLTIGQDVKVKIIAMDQGKINLSIKKTMDPPARTGRSDNRGPRNDRGDRGDRGDRSDRGERPQRSGNRGGYDQRQRGAATRLEAARQTPYLLLIHCIYKPQERRFSLRCPAVNACILQHLGKYPAGFLQENFQGVVLIERVLLFQLIHPIRVLFQHGIGTEIIAV